MSQGLSTMAVIRGKSTTGISGQDGLRLFLHVGGTTKEVAEEEEKNNCETNKISHVKCNAII